jgi:OOP family OmpA-OmpF porin
MKKLLLILAVLSQNVFAQDSVELTIYFEDGSDVPSMPEMAMLDEIAQHPNSEQLRFWVVGHTDDKGSSKFNVELSKERARMVAYHLLYSGIKPYNILFEHYGEECPVNENEDKTSRAENRRVEVLISNIGELH